MFIESRWSGGRCNLFPSVCLRGPLQCLPCTTPPACALSRDPGFLGSRKDLPRSSWKKPLSALLGPKVQSHGKSGFPEPTTAGVLKPGLEGKEKTRQQECFLRPAGCWDGTSQPPFFYLVPVGIVQWARQMSNKLHV